MGDVIPIQRAVSIRQCRRVHALEELAVAQFRLGCALWRDWNRFWWGA